VFLFFGASRLFGGQIGKLGLTPTRMVSTGATPNSTKSPGILPGPFNGPDRAEASSMLGAPTSRSVTGRYLISSIEHSFRGYISAFFAISANWLQSQYPSTSPAYDFRTICCPLYFFLRSFARLSASCTRRAEMIHSTSINPASISLARFSTAEISFWALSADLIAPSAEFLARAAASAAISAEVFASPACSSISAIMIPEICEVLTVPKSSPAMPAMTRISESNATLCLFSLDFMQGVNSSTNSPRHPRNTTPVEIYSTHSQQPKADFSDTTSEAVRAILVHRKRENVTLVICFVRRRHVSVPGHRSFWSAAASCCALKGNQASWPPSTKSSTPFT
jgi:hypothetical protein